MYIHNAISHASSKITKSVLARATRAQWRRYGTHTHTQFFLTERERQRETLDTKEKKKKKKGIVPPPPPPTRPLRSREHHKPFSLLLPSLSIIHLPPSADRNANSHRLARGSSWRRDYSLLLSIHLSARLRYR